jgi:hypothetical protein
MRNRPETLGERVLGRLREEPWGGGRVPIRAESEVLSYLHRSQPAFLMVVVMKLVSRRSCLVLGHPGALRSFKIDCMKQFGLRVFRSGPARRSGSMPCMSAACSAPSDSDMSALAGSGPTEVQVCCVWCDSPATAAAVRLRAVSHRVPLCPAWTRSAWLRPRGVGAGQNSSVLSRCDTPRKSKSWALQSVCPHHALYAPIMHCR